MWERVRQRMTRCPHALAKTRLKKGELDMRLRPMLLAAAISCVAAGAQAEGTSGNGSFTLPPITIVGRIQRPIAAVDVNRVPPTLPTVQQKPPSVEAIARAVGADPF